MLNSYREDRQTDGTRFHPAAKAATPPACARVHMVSMGPTLILLSLSRRRQFSIEPNKDKNRGDEKIL